MNGYYHIEMTAINDTETDIDMSDFRISFRRQDKEIDWFRGTDIGVVRTGEKKEFIINSTEDLSGIQEIYYEKFNFIN